LGSRRGARRLTADVSDSAQDFFEKRGFTATQRNTVQRGGECSPTPRWKRSWGAA
jgi:putative acetyltransferase